MSKAKQRYVKKLFLGELNRTLGKGAFGTVYLTKQDGTDNYFAVKETFQNVRYKVELNREADVINTLKHPAIIKVFHMFYTHKKDGTYLNIVMEYLPISLHDLIQQAKMQRKQIPECDIKYYMFQLCRACAYLSRRHICHRDIKPHNILVHPNCHEIRLCDFGSAKVLTDGEWNKHYICSRFYRAPELLCESNYYTCTVDSWSIGCVMAEMYLGEPLFAGLNTLEQLQHITQLLGPTPPGYPQSCTQCTVLLLLLLLSPKFDNKHSCACNHKKVHPVPQVKKKKKGFFQSIRISKCVCKQKTKKNVCGTTAVTAKDWKNLLQRRYKNPSKEAADLLRLIVQYDPKARVDLMDALFHPFLREVGLALTLKVFEQDQASSEMTVAKGQTKQETLSQEADLQQKFKKLEITSQSSKNSQKTKEISTFLEKMKWAPTNSYSNQEISGFKETFKHFKPLTFLEEEIPYLKKTSDTFADKSNTAEKQK
ncbi:hypothetical protein RFI_22010 [Reticulomyxa filosa]|uniref:Mitogen-activated protein kinase n=1 Tax=Reticulomyxa filosa TaxID=46433 RepID=X6MQJ6_RETFI|nr:hypothetical protein RFI_22010 [Reticulomyxa filosa]|eukprot:ETO15355.1 hypothetical protein RFI_22010 [Reticulomyxa filosa]